MKKSFIFFMIAVTLIFQNFFATCEAKDVYVATLEGENVDLYVVEDSIVSGNKRPGIYFDVKVKLSKEGRARESWTWRYYRQGGEPWLKALPTSSRNEFMPVEAWDPVFEYCMKYLGKPFHVEGKAYL